jgi:hypothetical protein
MASVNQTRPHWVNQMGKTHSKPLAAWHGMAGERHGCGMGTACYVRIGLKHATGNAPGLYNVLPNAVSKQTGPKHFYSASQISMALH